MNTVDFKEKRLAVRRAAESEVSVFPENDIFLAKIVDISETGMRIISEMPQEIRIQVQDKDTLKEYDAQVVWARANDDGTMEYGLKYMLVESL